MEKVIQGMQHLILHLFCFLVETCCVSDLIRLKDSLISIFWVWPGVPMASQMLGFFDNQYIWKETIDTFVWPLPIFFIYLFPCVYLSDIVGMHLIITFFEVHERRYLIENAWIHPLALPSITYINIFYLNFWKFILTVAKLKWGI